MFKITGKHVPPPPNMPSPLKWGDEETVRERLRDGIADLQVTRRMCAFKYPFSPAESVEFFRLYYGPTQRAFDALDADGQAALRSDLEAAVGGEQSGNRRHDVWRRRVSGSFSDERLKRFKI